MRIGLLSDTHGYWGQEITDIVLTCDEIWHAGDLGGMDVLEQMESLRPVRAVFGNIDDHRVRAALPHDAIFQVNGADIFMTHIAGYPGTYNSHARHMIDEHHPGVVICGHSHILKVMKDPRSGHLHMNPGAAGHHGFHVLRTMLIFTLQHGLVSDLSVVEFGRRGR